MSAPQEVIDLVKRFEMYFSKYTSPSYNETEVRREFIDPFFKALGWDVDNTQGHDERYKEVIHEDTVKVGDSTKAPDYSFRIGGMRKFFVEAKKPAVNLKENPEPAYQVRRYAWSAQLPVSILTDFEEFIIYDCTARPSEKDKASACRVGYYTFREYVERWDEIAGIFSKQAIYQGGFDTFTDSLKAKKGGKGTAGIDDAFLAEIEGWRDLLARNLALRNTDLSVRELNLAVQKTIDRIVFLRICEDRGVEEYGQLQNLAAGKDVYERLKALFLHADEKYNSGLFHFSAEAGREDPDTLTQRLLIDDKVLKEIVGGLYYPASPYEFSVFPADILGHVYEQFLGKVIRLTPSHQAKVEEKPEVKKAGGVFYTPTYIVDYIVRQTVGRLTEGRTPAEVSDLRILDPACGSGSFLIGAYQHLLDWHVGWYIDHLVPLLAEGRMPTDPAVQALLPPSTEPKTKGRGRRRRGSGGEYTLPVYQVGETDWRLTTEEKKRILLNNIFGVDIDQQAVEVTKLSLLLKVLEGERSENISKQLKITQERVLPSLHENIKCGNSLIGPEIYADAAMDDEACYRINAFEWEREFAGVMERGGFDAVIGNPPYVRQEILGQEFKEYAKKHYAVYHGVADLYTYFIEKGVSLLRDGGQFSYIVANKWMRANYGKPLRAWLKERRIEEIVDFGDLPVFQTATTYPCIIRVSNGCNESRTLDFSNLDTYVKDNQYSVCQYDLDEKGWSLVDEQTAKLLRKITENNVTLKDYVDQKIFYGIKTGLNEAFVIDEKTKIQLIEEDPKCADIIKPFLIGRDIKRYTEPISTRYVLFIPWHFPLNDDPNINGASKKAESEFKKEYPSIYNYIIQFKDQLSKRNAAETGIRYEWYALQRYGSKYVTEFEKTKILWPGISSQIASFSLDESHQYGNDNIQMIISDDHYLLGILNSKLSRTYLKSICDVVQGGFYRLKISYISQLPIRTIDPTDPADVTRHDRMVSLVEGMLDLNKKLAAAHLSSEKEMLKRRIDATDAAIDRLVYELYGLSEEEVAIVEQSVQ
jgi:hypothetical protein